MNDDKIASALGLRPLSEVREEKEQNLPIEMDEVLPPAIVTDEDDENIQDLEKARQNIQDIMSTGDEALRKMLEIAKQSESARGFEVVSTLMKTMLDANKDFVDISTKKKFAKEEIAAPRQEQNITNNNLIISTADLLKMIKGNDG